MDLSDLPTPLLILDRRRLSANTEIMAERMHSHGVGLRPHAKTAKSAKVVRVASKNGVSGLAVSTMLEARYFLDHGFEDLVYAVCIAPSKLDELGALYARGANLKIITDNLVVAEAISEHSLSHNVLIEVDCGQHRTGVAVDSSQLLELAAKICASGRSRVMGILTHAGHSYACRSSAEAAIVAETERSAAVTAAQLLRDAGYDISIISVGSTPTATHGKSFDGISEVRPGVYMFQDMFQAGIGSCKVSDLALSVLATVISNDSKRKTLTLDAGGLALSKDRSTAGTQFDCGFGLIADLNGNPLGGLCVDRVHQEHGEVTVPNLHTLGTIPIGAKVRIYPNHACMTAAAYNGYSVVDGGTIVQEFWPRCNGW